MKKDSPLVFILIVIVILVLGIGGVIFLQGYVPDIRKADASLNTTAKAVIRCEEVLKASLRDPEKAKFSGQKAIALDKERYQITGKIDAPNASGLMARGNYNCVFNFNTKSFDLLSLEGEDIWKPLKK